MKPPTDREKEIYAELMKKMETEDGSEEDIKAKVAKRHGLAIPDLDQIVIKVMAYSI